MMILIPDVLPFSRCSGFQDLCNRTSDSFTSHASERSPIESTARSSGSRTASLVLDTTTSGVAPPSRSTLRISNSKRSRDLGRSRFNRLFVGPNLKRLARFSQYGRVPKFVDKFRCVNFSKRRPGSPFVDHRPVLPLKRRSHQRSSRNPLLTKAELREYQQAKVVVGGSEQLAKLHTPDDGTACNFKA